MKVVFRADSSTAISSGHVSRCVTLARALRSRGHEVVFLSRRLEGSSAFLITDARIGLHELTDSRQVSADAPRYEQWLETPLLDDAAETARALKQHEPFDWIVLDSYALDARWREIALPRGPRRMIIDDYDQAAPDAHLVLDQNTPTDPDVELDEYGAWRLRGPRFALLRDEFIEARGQGGIPTDESGADGRLDRANVLVSFGGSDPANMTEVAIDALEHVGGDHLTADVVVGASNPKRQRIAERCEASGGRWRFHCQIDNIAQLMRRSAVALAAGGSSSWERCCVGLPSLVVTLEANQDVVARTLSDAGAAVVVGASPRVDAEVLASSLAELLREPNRLADFAERAFRLVDGRGTARVAQSLELLHDGQSLAQRFDRVAGV